jgi:hypothetical protein
MTLNDRNGNDFRLTTVGTDEEGFRRRLTAAPVILAALLYTRFRAFCTKSPKYWRLFSRTLRSRFSPISLSFSFVTRHRGQGQAPLSRIVARRTLEPCLSTLQVQYWLRTYFSG